MSKQWLTDPDGAIARRKVRAKAFQRFITRAFAVAVGVLVVAFVVGIFFGGVYLFVHVVRAAWGGR